LISNAAVASSGGQAPPAAPPPQGVELLPDQAQPSGPPKDRDHPSYLAGRTFAMALLDSLTGTAAGRAKDSLTTKKFPDVNDIVDIVGKLPDSNIRDVLLANIASAKNDIADLRDSLATWFDGAMERLTGDYKRDLKKLSLIIGLLVAIFFNADSVRVSRALWGDATLRGNIVGAASEIVDKGQAVEQKCTDADLQTQTGCLLARLKTDQDRLRPFPIGWPDAGFWQALVSLWTHQGPQLDAFWVAFMKILGLAFTGVALSLGAPFWFDLLGKFMNIRGAGAKPKDRAQTT